MHNENPMDLIGQLADETGGTVTEVGLLSDGSGFATLSTPLPSNHWLYERVGFGDGPQEFVPPAPWTMLVGGHTQVRRYLAEVLRPGIMAGVRDATRGGRDDDFDPDALVNQSINGLLGVHTESGMSTNPEDRELFDTPNPGSLKDVLLKALALAIDDKVISFSEAYAAIGPLNVMKVATARRAELREREIQDKRETYLKGEMGWEGMDEDPDIADLVAERRARQEQ